MHAYADRNYDLLTTHSPEFLGLRLPSGKSSPIWGQSNMGEGIIIGALDSGVTAGHPSFADHGMPRPPAKWKGRCDFNGSICNNKLVGARSFVGYSDNSVGLSGPPIDRGGHNTHTASTATGAPVDQPSASGRVSRPGWHLARTWRCTKCATSSVARVLIYSQPWTPPSTMGSTCSPSLSAVGPCLSTLTQGEHPCSDAREESSP